MNKRLGRGLSALIPETDYDENIDTIEEVDIKTCRPNPYQPRKRFDADALEELKISILEYGIIQPLIVRKSIKGYEIVAGERRYRAAKEAGLEKIPVIIKDLNDDKMMEIALLENLQREDLSIIEEALAYKSLIQELSLTQDGLSEKLGKSRSHIANTMRLLSLPEDIIIYINNGELTMGHGRALLGLKDKDKINLIANEIREKQLNVRQVEQMIHTLNKPKQKNKSKTKQKEENIFIKAQAITLREVLGTNVQIKKTKNKGKIEIDFYSDQDLENIINLLKDKA